MVVNPHSDSFVDETLSQDFNPVRRSTEYTPRASELKKIGSQYNSDRKFLNNFQIPRTKVSNEKNSKRQIVSDILHSMK